MTHKLRIMKKILILTMMVLLIGCAYASSDSIVEINGAEFKIPVKYQGGDATDNEYQLDNEFSIRCIDEDVPKAIGLWACENDYHKDLNINDHPARHYCQYNKYVGGNHSHIYFASDNSIYEIAWTDNNITKDIKNLIKNTPKSKIDDDTFYYALNESIDIYKQQRTDKLNQEAEYNYLEAKYQSQYNYQNINDDRQFKEILLTYYR